MLKDHEKLILIRKEKGWSQEQAAHRLGLTRRQYGRYERGLREVPKEWLKDWHPVPKNEVCCMMRKRLGWTQRELALLLKVSRGTINRMERGLSDYSTLVTYWGL